MVTTADPIADMVAMFDAIDNQIDAAEKWPFIGNFAKPIATVLDPIRQAVDAGILENVRTAIDQVDDKVRAMSKEPFIGGLVAPLVPLLDRFRALVDAPKPAAAKK